MPKNDDMQIDKNHELVGNSMQYFCKNGKVKAEGG